MLIDSHSELRPYRRSAPMVAVAVGIFLVLTLPRLLSHGMFVDGVVYAAIARNMAVGLGSFWQPHFTATQYPLFFEHPPLGLWLESQAFRLFGDSVLVEAFFGWGMGLLTLWLVVLAWRSLGLEKTLGAWLPLTLFAVMPVVSFAFTNNLLECQETVCTTTAALLGILGVRSDDARRAFLLGLGVGLFVAAACLIKGPTGLFPLIVPFAAAVVLVSGSRRRAILVTLGSMLALGAAALALSTSPDARAALASYLQQQLWRSMSGERTTGQSHLATLALLGGELAVPVIVLAPLWLWARLHAPPRLDRRALFLFIVALSASLPIMLSARHANRYLVPSLPFFAMALAAFFAEAGTRLEGLLVHSARPRRWLVGVATLLSVVALVAMVMEHGKVRKAQGFHHDFTLQPLSLPDGEVIGVCPESLLTFSLRAEFARSFNVSLAYDLDHRFVLVDAATPCSLPERCEFFHPPEPSHYRLYDCGLETAAAP